MKKKFNQRSFTLIETLVALSILIMGLLSSVSLLTKTRSLNTIVSDRLIAAHLAQEGIELVRNLIDTNVLSGEPWNKGIFAGDWQIDYNDSCLSHYNGSPLRFDDTRFLYSYDFGQPTKFIRKINISYESNDEMRVKSIVTWKSHRIRSSLKIVVEDHFYRE